MIILYVLGALLALILLLLILPLGLRVKYADEIELTLLVLLFIPIKLYPGKPPKEEKERPQWLTGLSERLKKAAQETKRFISRCFKWIKKKLTGGKKPKPQPAKEKKNAFASLIEQRGFTGAVSMILKVAGIAAGRAGKILKGLLLSRFELNAAIGGEDAAQAAINYGRWCAVLFPAISMILGAMRGRRKRNVCIMPVFTRSENTISIFAQIYVFPILVVWHALCVFARITVDEIKERIEEAKRNAVRSV